MNMPFKPAMLRDPFHAYVCDDETLDILRPVASDLGWPMEKCHKGGLRNAVQSLSVSASPNILFVDLSESSDPLNDINALAEVCEPGTVVIAAGEINDVRLYRDLVGSGIQDYLLKPLSGDQVREAIGHAQAMLASPRSAEASAERAHQMITVVGTRGGAGASTIATSIAWLMAEQEQRHTALLDLDIHFGTGALALDLEPGRGLIDAIDNPSRIDALFIERAMVRASDKLSLLSAEAPVTQPVLTDGTALRRLEEELQAAFDATVIDMPRGTMIVQPQLLADTEALVLVTDITLAAARDTIRLLSWARQTVPSARVLLVGNKYVAGAGELSRKDFEDSVERPLDIVFPYDAKAVAQGAKLGRCWADMAAGTKTAALWADLAARIVAGSGRTENDVAAPATAGGTSLLARFNGMTARLSRRKG